MNDLYKNDWGLERKRLNWGTLGFQKRPFQRVTRHLGEGRSFKIYSKKGGGHRLPEGKRSTYGRWGQQTRGMWGKISTKKAIVSKHLEDWYVGGGQGEKLGDCSKTRNAGEASKGATENVLHPGGGGGGREKTSSATEGKVSNSNIRRKGVDHRPKRQVVTRIGVVPAHSQGGKKNERT